MSVFKNWSKQFCAFVMVSGATSLAFAQTNCPASGRQSVKQCNQTISVSHVGSPTASIEEEKDIVDTAVGAGSFNTLVAAVKAADLVEVLKSKGPFTVFAPTDEAFAKLPKGTVEMLLKPENKAKLIQILTYHVVPGRVDAAQVVKMNSANSVAGPAISIVTKNKTVMVDNAKVLTTDISCSNGLIHVIDAVILPRDIVDIAVSAGSFKTEASRS